MYAVIGFLGLFGALFFLIKIGIAAIKKEKKPKNLIFFAICVGLFFSGVALTPEKGPEDQRLPGVQPSEDVPAQQTALIVPSTAPEPSVIPIPSDEIVTLPVETESLNEAEREEVLRVDSAIWDRIMSAETNYNNLLTVMSSADSPYSVYKFCDDLESLMISYATSVNNISDKRASEYVQCASLYFYQIESIAKHVKKFSNETDMSELTKAEDDIEALNTYTEAVVIARFSYLSECGFSDDEIIEIGNASVE